MNQMTIFEAIENKPENKVGLLNRWHIVKCYEGVEVLVGTAIPGEEAVRIIPTKLSVGIHLDQETHNRVMAEGTQVLSYANYEKWLAEYGFKERDVRNENL